MRYTVVNEQGTPLETFESPSACRKFIAQELETTVSSLKTMTTQSRGRQKGEAYRSPDRKKFRLIVETDSLPKVATRTKQER